ncbi:TTK protein kinase [Spizellomyces punctatus DAOM BR117]|uniref:TTK protein kinase n=1 Tax=Spizellomyces punctatus (strain DAOM BR117) TaxID=645134 RepID=A0A0L0HDJ2_SPIPD|nr:TTK protein kinase [Spizellomyces punctatus DAOM BR117]KNC99197.1 TTK protein kinase [Spizellomyces punctatus DAOM BR117]|eukprot:XP_016607237.1 TTK protein kinase [Spizellomyces punctatus DAOM BR117]
MLANPAVAAPSQEPLKQPPEPTSIPGSKVSSLRDLTPSSWWEHLRIEKDRGANARNMLRLYKEATSSIPTDKYRNDPFLLELWLDNLQLLRASGEDHGAIRDQYKFLKSSRIGAGNAKLYLAWANFERVAGYIDRAKNVLLTGISQNAYPVDDLRSLLSKIVSENVTSERGPAQFVGGMVGTSGTGTDRINKAPAANSKKVPLEHIMEAPVSSNSLPVPATANSSFSEDASFASQQSLSESASSSTSPPGQGSRQQNRKGLTRSRIGKLGPPARVSVPQGVDDNPNSAALEGASDVEDDMSMDSQGEDVISSSLQTSKDTSPPSQPMGSHLPSTALSLQEQQGKPIEVHRSNADVTSAHSRTIVRPLQSTATDHERMPAAPSISTHSASHVTLTPMPLQAPPVNVSRHTQLDDALGRRGWSVSTPSLTQRPPLRRTVTISDQPSANSSSAFASSGWHAPSNRIDAIPALNAVHLSTPIPPTYDQILQITPTIVPTNSSAMMDWRVPAQSQQAAKDKTSIMVNGVLYKKLGLIGRGGSSKVYKIMSEDGKLFAMKKVKLKGQEDSAIEGYLNEIALLKRLDGNERIIRLVNAEINEEQGYLLMVLEYGEIDLAHVLQKEQGVPLSLNFIRMYWEQMLRAVHAIHEENIIHSDLKPANFLLVGGALKLIDFGIAKSIPNDTTNIQRDHQTGTINYMAPEAIAFVEMSGSKRQYLKLGRSSDVWSLGCILYQLVYGRPPFAHLPVMKKLQCIVDPSYTIEYGPIEDSSLLEAIQSCLQRDPRKRMTIPELLAHRFLHPAGTTSTRGPLAAVPLDRTLITDIVQQVLAFRDIGGSVSIEEMSKVIYEQILKGEKVNLGCLR